MAALVRAVDGGREKLPVIYIYIYFIYCKYRHIKYYSVTSQNQ